MGNASTDCRTTATRLETNTATTVSVSATSWGPALTAPSTPVKPTAVATTSQMNVPTIAGRAEIDADIHSPVKVGSNLPVYTTNGKSRAKGRGPTASITADLLRVED